MDLKGDDIVIIGLGQEEIHLGEIQSLTYFVSEGGGLFIIGGEEISSPLNKPFKIGHLNNLSSKFGITFKYDRIKAGKNHMTETTTLLKEQHVQGVPVITKFSSHPIAIGISEILYVGVPLEISGGVQAIAISDDDMIPSNCVVLASVQYGKGKVVATGSFNMFLRMSIMKISMAFGMAKPDHVILTMNIMKWLS
ncbi:MAG: hypothetical protein ACTSRS_06480 [Candidatus Helarchaeota archaeon]